MVDGRGPVAGRAIEREAAQCKRNAVLDASLPHQAQHARDSVAKDALVRKQAYNDIRLTWEIEEEPGMDEDALPVEEIQHERFLGPRRRYPDNGIPSSFRSEDFTRGMVCRCGTKCMQVAAHARQYAVTNARSLGHQ